jgi:hypothetical protein
MSNKVALDRFGKLLMTKVRDEAITNWRMIVQGTLKGERASRIREVLKAVPENQQAVFLQLVPDVVDTVLHHLLWTFEQVEDVDIAVRLDDQTVPSLREASDGLAGELYSDEGWIARFSKEHP